MSTISGHFHFSILSHLTFSRNIFAGRATLQNSATIFPSVFAKLRIFPEWRSCCEIKLKTFLNNCVSVKSFDSQKKSLLGGKNRRLKCKPFLTSCIRFHTVNNCPLKWSMTGFEPGTSAVRNLCYNHRHNWKDLVRMSSQVIAVLRIWKHCFLITERILIADKSVPNCQFLCTK